METTDTKIGVNRTTDADNLHLDDDEGTIRVIEEDLSRTKSDEADANDEDTTSNTVSGIIHELKNLTRISPSTSACSVIDCEMESSKFSVLEMQKS